MEDEPEQTVTTATLERTSDGDWTDYPSAEEVW